MGIMQNIEITLVKPEDFDAFWPAFQAIICKEDTYAYDPQWTKEEACQHWFGPKQAVFFVKSQNDILGSYYLRPNAFGPGGHISNAGFMVSPAHQNKGIGRLMGQDAIQRAKAQGFQAMQFNRVVSTNTQAVALWQSLGFNIIGTVPRGFKHKTLGFVDTYIMHRFL